MWKLGISSIRIIRDEGVLGGLYRLDSQAESAVYAHYGCGSSRHKETLRMQNGSSSSVSETIVGLRHGEILVADLRQRKRSR